MSHNANNSSDNKDDNGHVHQESINSRQNKSESINNNQNYDIQKNDNSSNGSNNDDKENTRRMNVLFGRCAG